MSATHEMIPFSELPVELPPYVDAERLVLDRERVEAAAARGCFGQVSIEDYAGQTTSYSMDVMGMSGGAAMAGRTAQARKAPLGDFRIEPATTEVTPADMFEQFIMHDHPDLTLRLNMAEIQQRLGEQRANLRDPAVWAKPLHASLRESLRKAAWQHMVWESAIGPEAALGAIVTGSATALVRSDWTPSFGFPEANIIAGLEGMLLSAAVLNGVKLAMAIARRRSIARTCFSLLPGLHLDRYAATRFQTIRSLVHVQE